MSLSTVPGRLLSAANTFVSILLVLGGLELPASAAENAGTKAPPFHILQTISNSFIPGSATLPGLPTLTIANADGSTYTMDSVGYQDGAFVNGQALYFPWQVLVGGSTWVDAIDRGIGHSVMLSYNTAAGVSGFNDPANWSWFDLSTLPYAGKGTMQPGNPDYNTPAGYMGGTVVGDIVYPTPDAHHAYPVFVAYDSSKPFPSPDSYQTFVPPPMGGVLGRQYGWCSATNDGRYVYYAPLANSVNGDSGNIFRYDTTLPFSDIHSWSAFDMGINLSRNAESFQSAAYDGHRFVYYIPFHKKLIVRYDTWGGGAAADPAAFTNRASYMTLDPTKLNTEGYPQVTGQGSPRNLAGFTGAAVAWDSAHQNEYLYFVPWAVFPGNITGGVGTGTQNPVLESTAARVRIGTQNGPDWNFVDISSTVTTQGNAPNWEIYSLKQLTQNRAWPATWAKTYPSSVGSGFAGQSTIAGWQIAYVSASPTPKVGFVPDTSRFFVEHNVDHLLSDPSGWSLAPVPDCCSLSQPTICPATGYHCGTMGGAYDPVNSILYPSSPGNPLFAVQFSALPH